MSVVVRHICLRQMFQGIETLACILDDKHYFVVSTVQGDVEVALQQSPLRY